MSVDYLLDSNGDIDLTNNTIRLTDTIEQSSRQQVLISLRTYKGEWAFNILAGIPWIENENNNISVLGKGTKRLIDSVIQQNILERENIVKIISYESILDKATRQVSISCEMETNEGSTISLIDLLAT